MTEQRTKTLKTGTFLCILAAFAFVMGLRFFDGEINAQDTTVYAFSYRYGFLSRGLMGSLLVFLDSLGTADLMNYDTIYAISICGTLAFYVAILGFFKACLDSCRDTRSTWLVQLLAVCICVYAFGEFVTYENFGRVDVFLAVLMLGCMILLVREKAEWLIPIFCALGMLIHQGFIFMNINIVLVILLVKMLTGKEERRRYYTILFAVTLAASCALFLYFEFFSHVNGEEIYETVKALARQLSVDGRQYAPGIINHEILGEGVFMDEWPYHVINYAEAIEFLILFLPYLILGAGFAGKLYKKAADRRQRLAYLAIILGAWTVLPEILLKIDYGRYMYEIVFYYLAVVMMLIALKEEQVTELVSDLTETVREHYLAVGFFVAYPMILMPFLDVLIANRISMALVEWLQLAPAKTW